MIDKKLIDVQFTFDGMLPEPTLDEMHYAGAKPFPDKFFIERSEWDDRIREHEKHESSADYFSGRFTHQGSSHECVAHGAQAAFSCAYNRQLGGLEHDVWFSPLALYTRITNGRQWGGSSVIDSRYEMIEYGMIPDHDGPEGKNSQYEKFKHTVHQTAGRSEQWWPTKGWIRPGELPDGWKETAEHFRALEVYTIPNREAHASALLHGFCIVNGRNGHSIPHMKMVKENGRYLSKYKDSYNVFRYDTDRLWGGGYIIRSTTMPHDPTNPAESTD